jgi:hypothetical protein
MFTRISKLFMLVLPLLITSCGPQASSLLDPPVVNTPLSPVLTEAPLTTNVEVVQFPASASENEQVYPYYLPLATKPDIAPQTINGITAVIDWVYVDESRVALQYTISNLDWPDGIMLDATSVQVSSATIENIGYGGGGGGSLPADKGVITGYLDQLLVEGTLNADEHPNIDLSVDVPVNGSTAMPPADPGSGQQLAPQESLSLPDIGTFHFGFSASVHKGIKVKNIGQTVVANDVSMTLKALVLNPSRAEALICFQMPSDKDWGLTASTINIGGRDYRFSGGGIMPGVDGKDFSLTDPERCSSVGFDILYDEPAISITLIVHKLVASLPESIDKEHVNIANQRLAEKGIEFDYVPVEHGANIEILKRPEGAPNMEIYPLIWEALADQYEGPWVFQVEIKQ